MDMIFDPGQDRLVIDLYAWIVTDKSTGLEGLFAINGGPTGQMQAITSSPDTARKIGDVIRRLPYMGKRFRLVRFTKAEVLQEFLV